MLNNIQVRLGVVLGLALLTALPAAATSALPLPVPAPIPPGPADALVPAFVGSSATPHRVAHPRIPQHPLLARNGRSSMHNDAYSSDAYTVAGPLGSDLDVTSRSYGVRECATMTFDSRDRIEALCGGLEGFTMMLIDPETLDPLAELTMPGRDATTGANPFTDICGGTYFFLTNDDVAYATTTTSEIWEVRQDGDALVHSRSWALAPRIPEGDCLVAVAADWSGLVWFFTQQGTVGTLDLGTGAVRTLRLGTTEGIYNSVSVDETGGVYVVTTHAAYRLDAAASGRPRVTWREVYDRGSTTKPGMLSQGSGTSPTLIGRRWLVIADNAEPRMRVLVYDRRASVSGSRLRCRVPVFAAGSSTTENSLVAAGRSVLVENNYGYTGVPATMFGQTTAPGFARVSVRDGGCQVLWTNDVVAPTSVPKASLGNGLVYAYTKPARADGIEAWYFTAMDIRTGEQVWSRLMGTGTQWNNHYASMYLGPDGTAYAPVLSGLIRIADGS